MNSMSLAVLAVSMSLCPAAFGADEKPAAAPKPAIRYESDNFSIDHLPDGWRRRVFSRNDPQSAIELYTADGKVNFEIIAEVPNPHPDWTTDKYRQATQNLLADKVADYTLLDKTLLSINGLPGVATTAKTRTNNQSTVSVCWVYTTPTCAYQLITTGDAADEKLVRDEAAKIESTFRIIDPRFVPRPVKPASKKFRSERYGYSVVGLEPSMLEMSQGVRESSFGCSDFAAGDERAYLTVLAVPLHDLQPDMTDLAPAMMKVFNMPIADATDVRRIESKDAPGMSFSLEKNLSGGTMRYRGRVVMTHGTAYLMVALTPQADQAARLNALLDKVVFDPAGPRSGDPVRTDKEKAIDALMVNDIGNTLFGRQRYRDAAPFHRAAVTDGTQSAFLVNLLNDFAASKQLAEALAAMRAFGPRFYDDPKILLEAAYLEGGVGDPGKAVDLYARLFKGKFENLDALRQYTSVLVRQRRFDDATAVVTHYRSYADSPETVMLEVDIEVQRGDLTRAIETLCDGRETFPRSVDLTGMLATAFLKADRPDDCITVLQPLIDTAGSKAPAWMFVLRGQAQMEMKSYRDGKASFEAAVAVDAGDKAAQSWLKLASDVLGEGDNSGLKVAIEAVPVPDALLHPKPAAAADFNALYRTDVTAIDFEAGKPMRTTTYQTLQVTSAAGVEQCNAMHFTFDPSFEKIYVNKLVVRDSAGQITGTGSVDSSYVQDAPSREVTSTEKVLTVPVPGLKVGGTIEMVITRENLSPSEKIQYKRTRLAAALPADAISLVLRGDLEKVRAVSSSSLEKQQIDGNWCWTVTNPKPFKYEPIAAESDEFVPLVDVTDFESTWAGEGADYLHTITDVLRPDPDVTAAAATITTGLKTDKEKIDAILNYVQSGLTYQGIEFGLRGRIPNRACDVIHNRYGDCKDHALLLRQLLTAAGIRADLALVASREPVQTGTPSLDQFDHMIVYVPGADGAAGSTGRWFDCTDKYSNLSVGVPFGLAGKSALVLNADHPALMTIPPYPTTGSGFDITRDATVTDDGDVVIHDVIRCSGYYASNFRSSLTPIEPADRGNRLREMLAGHGKYSVDLKSFTIDGIDQTSKPIVFDLHYTVAHRFGPAGDRMVGSIPAAFENNMLELDPAPDRRSPFEYRFPAINHSTVIVSVPDAYRIDGLAKPYKAGTVIGDDKVEMKSTDDGRLRVEFVEHVKPGVHPAAEYTPLQRQRESLIDAVQPSLVLKPVK